MGSRVAEEEEPLSPYARTFQTRRLNCCIIAIIGSKTTLDVGVIKMGLENTLIKHPRFSSLLVIDEKGGGKKWSRTKVDVDEHVINPNLDPNIDSPDQFVEDYITKLTEIPLNPNKPLWELHLLNLKTSNAAGIAVLKVHHSLGDGMSLISLLLACTRKTSDPDSLPTIPGKRWSSSKHSGGFTGRLRRLVVALWWLLVVAVNTLVDMVVFTATALFLKDDQCPIKDQERVEFSTKRLVHRIVSFDDVKLVKNAMNMTINDVVLGITQAGLSRYINRRYANEDEKETKSRNNLPQRIRVRALLLVNIRPTTGIEALAEMMEKESKIRWGNKFGYVIIPLNIASTQDDPLNYIRQAKAIVDRKKLSFEALFTFLTNELLVKFFGVQAAAVLAHNVILNTTLCFSNVVGPREEISFYGHPIAYIAPSVYGLPQSLTIHWQSCANKMTIALAVDQDVIPNPHQLCDDIEESLLLIKDTCVKRKLI
ncbi:hypothetical protein LguiB_015262 [Lonicera macranthoides]